jgi:hypothetical protein
MKNETTMNLSKLAAVGTRLDLALAEVRGEAKIKRLPTRGPRKGETFYTAGYRSGGYRASGQKVRGGGGCNSGRNNVTV